MEPRIDVHLLTLNEPAEWRDACIASLEDAPIQLHVLPGIPGRIGEARAAGYAQGTLPLVPCFSFLLYSVLSRQCFLRAESSQILSTP